MTPPRLPEPAHLVVDLKTLFLTTVVANWERMAEEARRRRQTHAEYLADLMSLEVQKRRERRIQRRVQEAHFPLHYSVDTFDFAEQPKLDRDALLAHHDASFVSEARNLVFLGPIGTGKTHLATSIALACCQRELRVRYVTAAELTTDLAEAKAENRLSRRLAYFARFDVVVLDELGYVPFDKESADLLFGFITKVYERHSLIVTTNLPFGRWTEVFQDATTAAAVIDRIVHHADIHQTEGESHRLKDARRGGRGRRKEARK